MYVLNKMNIIVVLPKSIMLAFLRDYGPTVIKNEKYFRSMHHTYVRIRLIIFFPNNNKKIKIKSDLGKAYRKLSLLGYRHNGPGRIY